MDECFDSLGLGEVFLRLDTSCGCYKIELDQADMNSNAFVPHNERYRYTRLPIGLKNDYATFQRTMDITQTPVK